MTGEMDLDRLLATVRPVLHPDTFVFVTLPGGQVPAGLTPRMTFAEAEGLTLICTRAEAQAHGLDHTFPCRMITLDVHSALEAVGFIARIATALAAEGMGVNPIAGYYHDHLFVPAGREGDAVRIIEGIAKAARGENPPRT